ncbi:MAG: alpha/beta hydrolase [Deltaproteobacteria bacterium]|nr:alpha/beta hydrolase [Deltaproteobacteria bacterium]
MLKKLTLLLLVLLVVAGGAYLYADPETRGLDEQTRRSLGGTYLHLPAGVTHYELSGPPDGQVVVLLHGANALMKVWDQTTPRLAAAGLKVLRYDQYGRGLSDRPALAYDRRTYQDQLLSLLDNLRLKNPVDLVGHSLGGAVAVDFASLHPERVRRLVLISPRISGRGPGQRLGWLVGPVVGEIFMRFVGAPRLIFGVNQSLTAAGASPALRQAFNEQTTFRGFERSVLAQWRGDALGDHLPAYRAVGLSRRAVLLIWGDRDPLVSREMIGWAQKAMPAARLATVPGAGHQSILQEAATVDQLIVEFLQEPGEGPGAPAPDAPPDGAEGEGGLPTGNG